MHANPHLEHYFHYDPGNISGQKCSNFQMSECHLEHRLRPPECSLSDSECIWNILGRNISEPKIIIFARNIFLDMSRSSSPSFSRLGQQIGHILREMKNACVRLPAFASKAKINLELSRTSQKSTPRLHTCAAMGSPFKRRNLI